MRYLLTCVFLVAPALASAQPTEAADVQRMATDDCARAREAGKTCVLSIEDEHIEGVVPTAGEARISGRGFGTAASLIRIRTSFIREILQSAEDLD